ncbi:MAG: exopolygalacturonase, partial [Tannerella sp.]|nr:exopolygalacturonase [Tannerella sp.]
MRTKSLLLLFVTAFYFSTPLPAQEKFPDGTLIPDWFRQHDLTDIGKPGKRFIITDYGIVN